MTSPLSGNLTGGRLQCGDKDLEQPDSLPLPSAADRAAEITRSIEPVPLKKLNNEPGVHEESPLLSPASTERDCDEDNGFLYGHNFGVGEYVIDDAVEARFQATKSVWFLTLLTMSIGGLQIAWSVELSNGSPFLLSLGLSKSLMALVWIAGPLSGTLVQPYVGMVSDNCRLRWGKRKPFMVVGAVATIASLIFLAWTPEFIGGLLSLLGADRESGGVKTTIICVAVLWVYILDFAINTVQAAIRAFIVDCAPPHQQEAANAMASRMTGVGNILGYIAGYVDLPSSVGLLGDTQFKDLCAIASIALGSTVFISVLIIPERDPRAEGPPRTDQPGLVNFFRKIFTSMKRLPPQTKNVCIVQFCAWVGFFPMLFYTSSYVGEIYVEPYLEQNPNMSEDELAGLYEKATRVGTLALLIFAITGLATNVFLPFLIAPSFDSVPVDENELTARHADYCTEKKSWLDCLVIPGFTLCRAWMFGQLLFTGSMLCTVFVRTVTAAIVLIGLVGITWALTLWAPWAIISAEIGRRDAALRTQRQRNFPRDNSSVSINGNFSEPEREDHAAADEEADQAGLILGIHNMAIAAPQILSTVGSSILFKILQKPRGTPGDHSIAIVMAVGGISVGLSAIFIARIQDESAPTISDTLSAAT